MDELLYTGITSASPRRKKNNEEKLSQRDKLKPAAEVVLPIIEKDKQRLGDMLLAIVEATDTPKDLAVKLLAIRMHREWLNKFEQQIKIVLRAKPLPTKVNHES
jgi:hypothetical protein